jgi:hypothetical protein
MILPSSFSSAARTAGSSAAPGAAAEAGSHTCPHSQHRRWGGPSGPALWRTSPQAGQGITSAAARLRLS